MIEPTPRPFDLEAGLAEIDQRLRQIQDELEAAEQSPAAGIAPPPQPTRRRGRSGPLAAVLQRSSRSGAKPDPSERLRDLERELQALSDQRDKLLASIRELLDGYQALLEAQPSPPSPAASHAREDVTLSVGPFDSLDGVRAFQRALAALPGVRETSLRGFDGEDRAIVDVRLGNRDDAPPTS